LALSIGAISASAQERVRKSIDAFTADELETYIHAVKKIREKSVSDPTVNFSYAHMAGLHNTPALFNGACMHHSYHFLAWHRAHLINLEDALRASDPPRTANVTVPFWDWTRKPTGKRYPVAFEGDSNAVAAHYGRAIDLGLLQVLTNSDRNSEPSQPWFPWSEVSGYAKQNTASFLGTALAGGGFENDIHDPLHGFVGGLLCCPSSAANDVIFWSFHTFFDVVWWWRQQPEQSIDDTIPCQSCKLNGMRMQTASRPNGPTVVRDVTNTVAQLGYTYDFTPEALPPVVLTSATDRSFSRRLPVLAELALRQPALVRQFNVELPKSKPGNVVIALEEAEAPVDIAYLGFVYLHPKSRPFDATDIDFRNRYLAGYIGMWGSQHAQAGHADVRELYVSIDLAAYPAITQASGEPLVVSVAIHLQAKAGGPTPLSGSALSPVELDRNTKIGSVGLRAP
jgi:tyrosinase